VVSFAPWPLYPQGKNPWYQLHMSLRGPQSQYEYKGGKDKNFCPCWEFDPGRPVHNLVTVLSELPRLFT